VSSEVGSASAQPFLVMIRVQEFEATDSLSGGDYRKVIGQCKE
jgi:hypothetical protein